MLKLFNKKKKDNKGFTLVELVVVIAILAILVGLLAPQYTKYVEKARKSSDASNLENMVRAVEVAIADTNESARITAGAYTITINNQAASNSKATIVTGAEYDGVTPDDKAKANVENAIKGVIGDDWADTVLKSKNWTNAAAKSTYISATVSVKTDGSFSVTYYPDELSGMTGTKGTK